MRRTHRPPAPTRPRDRSGKLSMSPYCIEDMTFTLEEIRRARGAA